jgi:hypothetical protein
MSFQPPAPYVLSGPYVLSAPSPYVLSGPYVLSAPSPYVFSGPYVPSAPSVLVELTEFNTSELLVLQWQKYRAKHKADVFVTRMHQVT